MKNLIKLLVVAMVAILMMTGCNKNEQENLQQEIANDVLVESFEERTKEFVELKNSIEDDELQRDFANVRLEKVNDQYEITADLVGKVFISKEDLDNAIQKIKDEKLEKLDVKISNDMMVTIYASRPDDTKTRLEDVKDDDGFDYQVNSLGYVDLPTYDDADWFKAKSDDEWLDENGIPMYIDASILGNEDRWAKIYTDEIDNNGNYFLCGRALAGRTGPYGLIGVTDKDIITISLNAEDKIALDIGDYTGTSDSDYTPEEITVKDYYEKSPTTIDIKIDGDWERTLYIDRENMSKSNSYNIGLDVKDGKIFVFADYVGP